MSQFIGEYECKVDSKCRVIIPAGLKKQLPADDAGKFVVNRGFEKCLTLYPFEEWQRISKEVNKLNLYNRKNREFVRYFFRGATELNLDHNFRILFPKILLEYAGITKELVLFAYSKRIEVWSKRTYGSILNDEPQNFASLAEEVMGASKDNKEEDEGDEFLLS